MFSASEIMLFILFVGGDSSVSLLALFTKCFSLLNTKTENIWQKQVREN